MNKEVKDKWVAALRSGNYSQCRYQLRRQIEDSIEYCCLGVLCDLAFRDGVCKLEGNLYDRMSEFLPPSVVDWAGLKSLNPTVNYEGQYISLQSLNDHHCLNFKRIADLIEAHYESV